MEQDWGWVKVIICIRWSGYRTLKDNIWSIACKYLEKEHLSQREQLLERPQGSSKHDTLRK